MRRTLVGLLTALAFAVAVPSEAHAASPPLVIVFDTSGSMGDLDTTGTEKLSTAKASMSALVRAQSSRVPLGLWTYPGADNKVDGCDAGGWIRGLSPDELPDATVVDAQIRMLIASGGTPTGPALRGAAQALKELGFDAATIVVVSDGQSNCGPPPCEVAQEIIDSGFELTVAAVAFDIAAGGTGELECLRDVTGGSFTRADDAPALIDELARFHTQDLELRVDAPSTVLAGGVITINATVTNPSGNAVAGATLLLDFDSAGLVPFVPAPQQRLPVLAAGTSITRSWTVATRSKGAGTANWRVLAGSADMGSVQAYGAMRITTDHLTRKDGGELLKDRGGVVLVLGDSYSSGEGTKDYIAAGEPKCHRSILSYGGVVGGDGTALIACSGAISRDFDQRQHPSEEPQFPRLANLIREYQPDVVLLTIGGNDVGFAKIIEACFKGDCSKDRFAYLYDIQSRSNWASYYRRISETINTPQLVERRGSVAPVIVSPYPNPLWAPSRGSCNRVRVGSLDYGFSPSEIVTGKDIVRTLNRKIEQGVKDARAGGYPVYYADTVESFAVAHSICETDSYFNRLTILTGAATQSNPEERQELFHPTAAGHAAWANALIAWSQRANLDLATEMPGEPSQTPAALLRNLSGRVLQPVLVVPDNVAAELSPISDDGLPVRGDVTVSATSQGLMNIRIENLEPGTEVRVTVRSDPMSLGAILVDDHGVAEGEIRLPVLSSGIHMLSLMGYDDQWRLVALDVPLQVSAGFTWAMLAAVTLGLLSLSLLAVSVIKLRRFTSTEKSSPID